MTEKYNELIEAAIAARAKSYAPYSGFAVGAALLTKLGKIYTGANIESASYTPTVCAERVAFFTAVHKGERDFAAIAVVGGPAKEEISRHFPPCGVCRQVMAEFCEGDFVILLYDGKEAKHYTLGELLPEGFGKKDLQ